MTTRESLIQAALKARAHAVAPFSNFRVGAALETSDGRLYTGCNIENASYGLTMCAERVAIFKAVSEGDKNFVRMVVAADTDTLTPPCGACRQLIWEFCGNIQLILVNPSGKTESFQSGELLPRAFDVSFLS